MEILPDDISIDTILIYKSNLDCLLLQEDVVTFIRRLKILALANKTKLNRALLWQNVVLIDFKIRCIYNSLFHWVHL